MNHPPPWVPDFLANLKYTARAGRPNVRVAADLTGKIRSVVYHYRRSPRGVEFRAAWDAITRRPQK